PAPAAAEPSWAAPPPLLSPRLLVRFLTANVPPFLGVEEAGAGRDDSLVDSEVPETEDFFSLRRPVSCPCCVEAAAAAAAPSLRLAPFLLLLRRDDEGASLLLSPPPPSLPPPVVPSFPFLRRVAGDDAPPPQPLLLPF
ncbi:unnamed protein product, partial [Ectocarpus sp. 12 AP-2014]